MEGESVEDFILWLNDMVATLATLSEMVEEHVVVEKVLRCVPPRLKQIVLAISTLLDIRMLTVVNLVKRLKMVEEDFEDPLPSTTRWQTLPQGGGMGRTVGSVRGGEARLG
jgi:hypothetical protein